MATSASYRAFVLNRRRGTVSGCWVTARTRPRSQAWASTSTIRAPTSTTPEAIPRTRGGCGRSRPSSSDANGSDCVAPRRRRRGASSSCGFTSSITCARSRPSAAWAAEELLGGSDRFALCALRPPGHHAERARAMGFCILNNLAVAVAHALEVGGAERVLVVDWDVHHGNGTEAIFASSSEVLYASIHQWPLYPGTGPASYEGEGPGLGFTLNLPVAPGAGNDEFCALIEHVVAPVARAWRPDLVAISAGYDAHREDPLADCLVDERGYATMAATVRLVADELDVPILVCLEGGYAMAALARSVAATIIALDGDAQPQPADPAAAGDHLERVGRFAALAGR